MGKQQSENIIPGGAVDLGERIHFGEVGSAGELDSSGGRADVLIGDAEGRVVAHGLIHGGGKREGLAGTCGGGGQEESGEGEGSQQIRIVAWGQLLLSGRCFTEKHT